MGILLISFVGSIIVFIPIPYFPILITAAFNKHLDPNLICVSSAAGAIAAKMIIFYASYYGRSIINTRTKKRMVPLERLLNRYGWLGAFIAALTPIPDDLVYIPLGIAKYNPLKFATATFTGKLILNEAIVWGAVILGRPFIERYSTSTSQNPLYLIIGAISLAVILGGILYLFLKIDWGKVIGKWFPWTTVEYDESKQGSKERLNQSNDGDDQHHQNNGKNI
ncbi:MAG TPA: VTT domain-containing protein [Nitrososphaeraceae archaeon]|jgi:membrane protein DedA with SNARE-associated domain|nr:VTT domain-containing protein [Nitrososphaeraceae archaeon]